MEYIYLLCFLRKDNAINTFKILNTYPQEYLHKESKWSNTDSEKNETSYSQIHRSYSHFSFPYPKVWPNFWRLGDEKECHFSRLLPGYQKVSLDSS